MRKEAKLFIYFLKENNCFYRWLENFDKSNKKRGYKHAGPIDFLNSHAGKYKYKYYLLNSLYWSDDSISFWADLNSKWQRYIKTYGKIFK